MRLQLLDEEITPKLDKLRKERTLYHELQKTKNELERIQKFCLAYQYTALKVSGHLHSALVRPASHGPTHTRSGPPVRLSMLYAQAKLDSSQTDLGAKEQRIAMLEKEAATLRSEIKASEAELQRLRAQRQKVSSPVSRCTAPVQFQCSAHMQRLRAWRS